MEAVNLVCFKGYLDQVMAELLCLVGNFSCTFIIIFSRIAIGLLIFFVQYYTVEEIVRALLSYFLLLKDMEHILNKAWVAFFGEPILLQADH